MKHPVKRSWHIMSILMLSLLCTLLSCQTAPKKVVIRNADDPVAYLFSDEKILLSNNGIGSEQIGYIVYDLDSNTVKVKHNETKSFIPASVQKIATTLMALDILGPEFRYKTTLSRTGFVDSEGVLHGDLFLTGTGDPSLSTADLMRMAEALRRKGIRRVEGNFYFDDTALISLDRINPNPAFANEFSNPGVDALSLDFNESFAVWQTDALDSSLLQLYAIPAVPLNRLGSVRDDGNDKLSGPIFNYVSNDFKGVWNVTGKLGNEKELYKKTLPVQKPGLYTAQVFSRLCGLQGITLTAEPGKSRIKSVLVAEHYSQALIELVEKNLELSNNLMSEIFLLTAAQHIENKVVKQQEAVQVLVAWLGRNIKGTDWSNYIVENGSGLSSKARVTPEQELAILRFADKKLYAGKSYLSLLPIGGWKGTLRKRLTDPHLSYSVWAKTGSINYGSALAGYFFSQSGKKYAFAIFISDLEKRLFYDLNPDQISDPQSMDLWLNHASVVQDGLVATWFIIN
jgi:serine-type D-Ala-D-Ala carboxypeptidase/endopeptidase (penicillin-binding protein 4)